MWRCLLMHQFPDIRGCTEMACHHVHMYGISIYRNNDINHVISLYKAEEFITQRGGRCSVGIKRRNPFSNKYV